MPTVGMRALGVTCLEGTRQSLYGGLTFSVKNVKFKCKGFGLVAELRRMGYFPHQNESQYESQSIILYGPQT